MRTGRDIRTEGSGNAGATNVARAHGKGLGVAVGLLDLAKGAGAVLLMRTVTADPRYTAAAGLAAIVGHVFPIFYGFRGGKGVGTAIGAFLVLAASPTLVCSGGFLLVVPLTRYVSLGSILAMVLLPPSALFHAPRPSPLRRPRRADRFQASREPPPLARGAPIRLEGAKR